MAAQTPLYSVRHDATQSRSAETPVLELIKVKLLAMPKEELVDMVLDLSRIVVQLEAQADKDKVAKNDLEKELDGLRQTISESSEKSSSLGDPAPLATSSPSVIATTMTNTASSSPIQQSSGSALDALTASLAAGTQFTEQLAASESNRQVIAHEIFDKYQIDADAQAKFYESRKLRNFAARQQALDLFVKRVGESQGKNVLSVLLGKGTSAVNHSRLFVQCVREVENRVVR